MSTTVLLCLLSFVFLCLALGIEGESRWKWLAAVLAFGFSGSFALNRIVMLDSTVSQFFLNLLVVVGVYASAAFALDRHRRC